MSEDLFNDIIQYAIKTPNLSDVHLVDGEPPIARIGGRIVRLTQFYPMHSDTLKAVFDTVVPEQELKERFTNERELDIDFSVGRTARFRINIYKESNGFASFAIRKIPFNPPVLKDIFLPPYFKSFIGRPNVKTGGIIILGGATGSGKTTTLAAFVEEINRSQSKIIITLEDPIEYKFQNKKSVISQRAVGIHVRDFAHGLRSAKRQDPDVIVVGEMRDSDSTDAALGAAESGHLVFTTLHTDSVFEMPIRIAVNFPAGKHAKILFILSRTAKALITQRLIISQKTNSVFVLPEVLIPDQEDRDIIASGNLEKLKEKAMKPFIDMKRKRNHSYHPREEQLVRLYKMGKLSMEDVNAYGDPAILPYFLNIRL